MKILKIKFADDPILGNLDIDLTNSNSIEGYKKIIFVGENGVGKTSLFNKLYSFLEGTSFQMDGVLYLNDVGQTIKASSIGESSKAYGYYEILKDKVATKILCNKVNDIEAIKKNKDDLRHHGAVFSRAQTSFKTKVIKNVGNSTIDTPDYINEEYDFTKIKQLFIDLETQSRDEYYNYCGEHGPITCEEYDKKYSKLFIFKSAFNNFFENVKYVGKQSLPGNDGIDIIFNKFGKNVSIDDLSTGEKQIVFRGALLLKNIKTHEKGFVLIDEPEISMHPLWENKLFDYYSNLLFKGETQIDQLFIATHSERILEAALRDKDALVIEIKNDWETGTIFSTRYDSPCVLPYVSVAEISYKIFNVYSNDLHLQLYDYIMSEKGDSKVSNTDAYICDSHFFDRTKHYKSTSYSGRTYESLSTAIRNDLHHGRVNNVIESDLKASIDLMYLICTEIRNE